MQPTSSSSAWPSTSRPSGAGRVSVGQGDDVSWVVLADPEDNTFCVLRQFTIATAEAAG